MDSNQIEKKSKASKPPRNVPLNIRRETKKKIQAELSKINKKDFGRKIHADDYILLSLSLVTAEHIQQLQEHSLSNADRLERDYRSYISKNGPLSKDEYLGKRLNGELALAALPNLTSQ